MSQIKCPNCGKEFTIDEASYAAIVSQVRDKEFEKQIEQNMKAVEERQESLIQKNMLEAKAESDKIISKLKSQVSDLESQNKLNTMQKDSELKQLQAELKGKDKEKEIAVKEALQEQNTKITELMAEMKSKDKDNEIAIKNAVMKNEEKIMALESEIKQKELEYQLKEKSIEEKHQVEMRLKDEQIEQYKNFKLQQSTKMIGESLEKHCENEFNKLRATGFQNAYFEKDNDARTGSKGDYIFRESQDGVEYISIMFEMKNEADETATKHKNEDFFKELDKDRNEKGCEYAVLVSMLESDNEYYNTGIVDVSHKYPKMYVIRPQFFIPVITFLRNAALNTLDIKKELVEIQNRNIDVSNFENTLNDFKDKFSYNYGQANKRFTKAIDEIDKTIQHLQKVREELLASDNQLRLANKKLDDLSIKKLTRNNPTMKEKFAAIDEEDE
ncbi:MAG: DUF2130 domain-containing protein [Lachnospiraceae bacterium]|nr:DUF2130 domain-containing protein [Lachnospiraceae bacterium]